MIVGCSGCNCPYTVRKLTWNDEAGEFFPCWRRDRLECAERSSPFAISGAVLQIFVDSAGNVVCNGQPFDFDDDEELGTHRNLTKFTPAGERLWTIRSYGVIAAAVSDTDVFSLTYPTGSTKGVVQYDTDGDLIDDSSTPLNANMFIAADDEQVFAYCNSGFGNLYPFCFIWDRASFPSGVAGPVLFDTPFVGHMIQAVTSGACVTQGGGASTLHAFDAGGDLWSAVVSEHVASMCRTPDGGVVTAGGGDDDWTKYDGETGDIIWSIPDMQATFVACGRDGLLYAVDGRDGNYIRKHDPDTGELIAQTQKLCGELVCVAGDVDGNIYVGGRSRDFVTPDIIDCDICPGGSKRLVNLLMEEAEYGDANGLWTLTGFNYTGGNCTWLASNNAPVDFTSVVLGVSNYYTPYRTRWELRFDIDGLSSGADPSLVDYVVADFVFEQVPDVSFYGQQAINCRVRYVIPKSEWTCNGTNTLTYYGIWRDGPFTYYFEDLDGLDGSENTATGPLPFPPYDPDNHIYHSDQAIAEWFAWPESIQLTTPPQ